MNSFDELANSGVGVGTGAGSDSDGDCDCIECSGGVCECGLSDEEHKVMLAERVAEAFSLLDDENDFVGIVEFAVKRKKAAPKKAKKQDCSVLGNAYGDELRRINEEFPAAIRRGDYGFYERELARVKPMGEQWNKCLMGEYSQPDPGAGSSGGSSGGGGGGGSSSGYKCKYGGTYGKCKSKAGVTYKKKGSKRRY